MRAQGKEAIGRLERASRKFLEETKHILAGRAAFWIEQRLAEVVESNLLVEPAEDAVSFSKLSMLRENDS